MPLNPDKCSLEGKNPLSKNEPTGGEKKGWLFDGGELFDEGGSSLAASAPPALAVPLGRGVWEGSVAQRDTQPSPPVCRYHHPRTPLGLVRQCSADR